MKSTKYIWMDGKFKKWKDAKIHVLAHTLHYGAGSFEGIRFYNTPDGPAIFRLKEHTKRFFYSAKAIDMKIPYSQKEINETIIKLVKKNKVKGGYIRPLAFYGYGKMGLNPAGAPVNVSIACWPWGTYLGEDAVKIKTSQYIRIHPQSTVADAKICGHYVNSILASIEVHKQGYHEALFLDYKGNVAEGPGENIFMVKKGVIYTPPLGTILAGITRDSAMTIAKDLGFKVVEKILKLKDLYAADECFFTGTAAEVTPIISIDKKKIGNGKIGLITTELQKTFLGVVKGRNEKYRKWLTYIKD